MKKQVYMKPNMQVVTIKTTTLLAGSPVGGGISTEEAQGDALSRDGGFWDDEE